MKAMATATADWRKVGDQYYRKIQVYNDVFDPDLELDNYIVTGAPYSGAVGRHFLRSSMNSTNGMQHYTAMKASSTHMALPRERNPPSISSVALEN